MKKISVLFLVILVSMFFAGVSYGATLTGKYKAMTLLDDKGQVDMDFQAVFKEAGLGADAIHIEFMSGGKCKMVAEAENTEGTFKVDGKTVTITLDDSQMKGTIDGSKIIFEEDDGKMVFEKM